jgi:hypothetical protein
MDLNMIGLTEFNMASPVDGWPVWIPLIVGLAPGLIYFIAITARKPESKNLKKTSFSYLIYN